MKFAYLIEPPFNYKTADGLVTGCDVELARTLFSMIGVADFEPIETEFAELLPGVARGDWQMTTGLFRTAERQKNALFSRPIWGLPDGMLVSKDNPKQLVGYRSIAENIDSTLAVIKDQFQHRSAIEFDIPDSRILIFDTYAQAAEAVINGRADAYASVGRAHMGFLEQNKNLSLDVVTVSSDEKKPAFGSFAFHKENDELRQNVDQALGKYLGSSEHRSMMAGFGFSKEEIDLVI